MFMRRLLVGVLGLVAASTVACTSDPDASSPLPDGAALLRDASEASKGIRSAHFTLAVNGRIPSIPVQNIEGDLTKDGGQGGAAKGTAKVEFGGFLVEGEFVLVDRILYFKGPTGGFQKMGDASRIYDPSTILDPDRGVARMLSAVAQPRTEARETVNGTATFRVAGKVGKDVVSGVVPGITTDVDIKIWVSEENRHVPVRAWLQLPPQQQGAGATMVEVSLSDLDKPVTVTAPV